MSKLFCIPHWATKWPKTHWVIKGINWGHWGLRHCSKLNYVMGTHVSMLNNSIILCVKFWLGILMKMNYRAGSWCAFPGRIRPSLQATVTRHSSVTPLNSTSLLSGERGGLELMVNSVVAFRYKNVATCILQTPPKSRWHRLFIPFLNRYNIPLQM
jgi:hypothetical protein